MTSASIVLYHNPEEEIRRIIECVEASSIDQLYLVDNSATDELAHLAGGLQRVSYHFNNANLGYGKAHNIAIRMAMRTGMDYHVVLNPDVYWQQDIMASLAVFMDEHPGVGLAMPQVLYPDGSRQRLCKMLPTPVDLFARRFIPFRKMRDAIDRRYELHDYDYDRPLCIPSLSGCFMFLRMCTLRETGLFDERYFMYGEDVDLCRRIGEVSETMVVPSVTVYHHYEKGSYHNSRLLRIHLKSMTKYFTKWGWVNDPKRRRINKRVLRELSKL